VAAVIVLLYAQPLTRVVRLTIDGDHVLLQLGDPPSPVPVPFADLLLEWINSRDNMNTATNRGSRWLFPGRRAAQPMNLYSLAASINDLGIPTTAGRAAAIRPHVLRCPHPSLPMPSATTRSPPPSSPRRAVPPGAGTPPATTYGHHPAGHHSELTTVE
jgi:hypothetical protein